MRRLGVLGWPVGHSRSPAMHNAALDALGLTDWHYQLLPVPPELFDETVRGLPGAGFVGANVTIPHKQAALALADQATDDAVAIGAANTLTFLDGAIHASNTDAPGFLAALRHVASDPPANALVLGAGGSARAVVFALRSIGVRVLIWNRSAERARALGAYTATAVPADLLVNCTSIGLGDSSSADDGFKQLPVAADALGEYATVVDLVYRHDGETELARSARRAGCAVVDGLDVLVAQGALSFQAWTGRQAPLEAMRSGARPASVVDSADMAGGVSRSARSTRPADESGTTPPNP